MEARAIDFLAFAFCPNVTVFYECELSIFSVFLLEPATGPKDACKWRKSEPYPTYTLFLYFAISALYLFSMSSGNKSLL